jgi:hypothetical protein
MNLWLAQEICNIFWMNAQQQASFAAAREPAPRSAVAAVHWREALAETNITIGPPSLER